jgi:signal transduction histidine kinase
MATTKILYIEDSAENRMLVRALLAREKYTIVEAEDGLSGIEAALREQPALILLDINLPGIDGYEVGVALRSFPMLRGTPIIAVTAYAMEGDRERTLVAGCDGYIAKPLDADAFPRQVAEFLRGKRERVDERKEAPFLRELNQRLVYRMVRQIEELRRLNEHFVRRAGQLEALHGAVQGITSELDVRTMLEKLLPALGRAIGITQMSVELTEPAGLQVSVKSEQAAQMRSVLTADGEANPEWEEVEWVLPLVVQQRDLGVMVVHSVVPAGAKGDEEQLLKIVASQVAIAVENARLYEGVKRQMAELRETQSQLVHAAKLAALGEMAAQVAHEINNPLTSVLGFASLLIEDLPSDNAMHEPINLIVTEATRARDIVRDLLDFSRQRPFVPQEVDLNQVLKEVIGLVRHQGIHGVTIEERYAEALPVVEVDPGRMKQVFLNLAHNAIQAMPRGGFLTVRTSAAPEEVTVVVTDSGTGIASQNLVRIFEPFFTTKPEVSGTGLGLSVSLGIVRQHGGTIEVASEIDKGSTFTVRIPRPGRVIDAEPLGCV